ncbi:hypothetical protein [Leifsonia sp. Le1]|uniref:hypothetical protein n=1 Tax=Leifsonia sp. Le1 TaxID=3404918 RepID=UPI003EBC06DE
MSETEPDVLVEADGSVSLIDRDELDLTASKIAALLTSGEDEIHDLANNKWEDIYNRTSPAFAVKVAYEATGMVAFLMTLPPNWAHARATTRRLERFHETINAKYREYI